MISRKIIQRFVNEAIYLVTLGLFIAILVGTIGFMFSRLALRQPVWHAASFAVFVMVGAFEIVIVGGTAVIMLRAVMSVVRQRRAKSPSR